MIWVIGGTKDSRDFIESFPFKERLVVTTATEYGGKLLEEGVKVISKKMDFKEMWEFIDEYKIEKIVDLSHPYAVEVSKNAIECSKNKKIKYFRFERGELENIEEEHKNIESLLKRIENIEENILVTLGSNTIDKFKNLNNLKNIYFRVLPKWDMLKKIEELGILPKNIIAMQGPFIEEMNIATIKQYKIKYLISKKAGSVGGEREKIEACKKMGVKLIYLSRPEIEYPNKYENMGELLEDVLK